nr:MAG TPA: calcineurin-like phosphoesterase [Caudoviricetes sp.]
MLFTASLPCVLGRNRWNDAVYPCFYLSVLRGACCGSWWAVFVAPGGHDD